MRQREQENATMLAKLSECLREAAIFAKQAEQWALRAEEYRKACSDLLAMRCTHCGSSDAVSRCGHDGSDRLCPVCLSNCMD